MKKKAFFYIILAGILWGTSGIFVEYLAPYGLSSLQMTFIRGFVSAIIMSVYVLTHNKSLYRANLTEIILYIASGVGIFFTSYFYFASMQASSVSTAVVLMYTAPIIVMIYSVAFLGERLTKIKTVSVIAMLVGCALVSGIIGGMKFDGRGIALGFMAGIAYSAYNIITKIQMRRCCNPMSASMYCFIFMSLAALCFAEPVKIIEIGINNPFSVILMIGCGVCTCVLPYFFYTLALKDLPVGTASALGIVEPMAATIFSVTVLGEVLDMYSLCGIVLILGAVFMLGKTKE